MEQNRVITIKGIGSLEMPVDLIKMDFTLEELNKDYKKGHEVFDSYITELQDIVQALGFKKTDLKTSEIRVTTEYDSKKKYGKYIDVFKGYNFKTDMSLSFDFDSQKLGEVFTSISDSKAGPKIEVWFTVKDTESAKKRLLGNASKDAKEKATILCESIGAKIGKLLKVDYNWQELDLYSSTKYRKDEYDEDHADRLCYSRMELPRMLALHKWDFSPKNISVTDEAYFIWEITD